MALGWLLALGWHLAWGKPTGTGVGDLALGWLLALGRHLAGVGTDSGEVFGTGVATGTGEASKSEEKKNFSVFGQLLQYVATLHHTTSSTRKLHSQATHCDKFPNIVK